MADFWTYAPEDFLLFSEQTYRRLFALHNAALWPFLLLAPLLLLGAALSSRMGSGGRFAAAIVFAAVWIVVAEGFVALRYAPINWAAAYVRPLFWLEAALVAFVVARSRPVYSGPLAIAGSALILLATLAYPLMAPLAARPLDQAEVAGIVPDPTALATLGLAFLVGSPLGAFAIAVVPALWLLASGATLVTLGTALGWLPWAGLGLAALLALLSAAAQRRAA
ncbi:MAG: hypothetical protein AAF371_11095 [Pseudomonadota bacterium]